VIKTIVVDDDDNMRNLIIDLLREYFPMIEICAEADNVIDGTRIIQQYKPDLVFLDIELKDGTGFHILQNLKSYNFKLIFITAFNDFAIKAIKFSAIDYILKPVNQFEFKAGVEKALHEIENSQLEKQINNFFELYENKTKSKKIILRNSDNMYVIDIEDIMYCRSDNSYTTFYLENGETVLMSKSIKEYNEILSEYGFFRSHQSYLVNLHYIAKLSKHDGGCIVLQNNKQLPVSTRRKANLLSILDKLAI